MSGQHGRTSKRRAGRHWAWLRRTRRGVEQPGGYPLDVETVRRWDAQSKPRLRRLERREGRRQAREAER